MKSLIEEAKASVPFWMMEIRNYDGLEIHPVHEMTDDTGFQFCEQCGPHEAHFWSVYGHMKEGGVMCFEDFETEEKVRHLRKNCWKRIRICGSLG